MLNIILVTVLFSSSEDSSIPNHEGHTDVHVRCVFLEHSPSLSLLANSVFS